MANTTVDRREIVKNEMFMAKKISQIKDGLNGQSQSSDVFRYCWVAFEAYVTDKHYLPGVWERIDAFVNEHQNEYRDVFDAMPGDFRLNLIQLSNCQIVDMRPNKESNPPKQIIDQKDLKQVMEVIYRVRCNLEHGGKNYANNDDKIIVDATATTFYELIKHFLIKDCYLDW